MYSDYHQHFWNPVTNPVCKYTCIYECQQLFSDLPFPSVSLRRSTLILLLPKDSTLWFADPVGQNSHPEVQRCPTNTGLSLRNVQIWNISSISSPRPKNINHNKKRLSLILGPKTGRAKFCTKLQNEQSKRLPSYCSSFWNMTDKSNTSVLCLWLCWGF